MVMAVFHDTEQLLIYSLGQPQQLRGIGADHLTIIIKVSKKIFIPTLNTFYNNDKNLEQGVCKIHKQQQLLRVSQVN